MRNWDWFETLVIVAFAVFIGIALGNHGGDQATLRDCATKGIAKMMGGGSIRCEVVRVPERDSTNKEAP